MQPDSTGMAGTALTWKDLFASQRLSRDLQQGRASPKTPQPFDQLLGRGRHGFEAAGRDISSMLRLGWPPPASCPPSYPSHHMAQPHILAALWKIQSTW